MARIVIAGASEASRAQLSRMLTASGYAIYRACASGGELRRALCACEDGIVVIAGALTDEFPDDLESDFGSAFQFLLIARAEALTACESPRIFKLTYPCPGGMVIGSIEMLSQLHMMRLPKRTGSDKALVDAAKALIMRRLRITEAEAHRHMQQYAMRHNMKMTDYASLLLNDSEGTEG